MSRDGILLLGGAGFIGTALARRLAAQSRQVHVISHGSMPDNIPGVNFHSGDLGDAALLQKLQPRCGTVIHLASATTPGASAGLPASALDNLVPTLAMLDKLQGWQDTHLVFLSSGGTIYGNPARTPVAETALPAPLSYHGAGKLALEGFFNAFRVDGHAVSILRPSNAYGPGQPLNRGFGLIRTVLQHILQGTTLEIWGDGENVRDFIYVEDVVNAIVTVIDTPADNSVYNVGSGTGYSLKQVAEMAQRVCGKPLAIEYRPARKIDVREVVLDISRIQSALGWRPAVYLEDGLQRTWDWLRKS
jgi:UDP-glucose 4-epimerase